MDTCFPRRGNSGLHEQVKPTDAFGLDMEALTCVSTCRVSQSWSAGRRDFSLGVLCIKPKSHYRQIQSHCVTTVIVNPSGNTNFHFIFTGVLIIKAFRNKLQG